MKLVAQASSLCMDTRGRVSYTFRSSKEAKTYRRNRYMIRVRMMLMRMQVPSGK
jgi:hypothetical protein